MRRSVRVTERLSLAAFGGTKTDVKWLAVTQRSDKKGAMYYTSKPGVLERGDFVMV